MRKQSQLLILAVGLFAVRVMAQDIVIAPTNGQAPGTHRQKHQATVEAGAVATKPTKNVSSAAKSEAHPARELHEAALKPTRKTPSTPKIAAKPPTPTTEAASLSAAPAPATVKPSASEVAPAPELPARPAWAMADTRDASSLQSEISNALARDPKLAHSDIRIDVNDAEVTLAGKANGTEERLQAERLAQSYAWNRRLVDHIEVVPGVSTQ